MKDFARARGRLRALSFHARLAYSVFLAFTAAGVAFTAWLLDDMVGLRFDRVDDYYAGTSSAAPERPADEPPQVAGGPVLDMPSDELDADVGVVGAMSQRKLLEVTHFHLFTMPVYLLILSHLFMLSKMNSRFKTSTIVAGTLGTALHVAAPWAATSGSTASIALYAVSGTAMGLSYAVMCIVPICEMWLPERVSQPSTHLGQRSMSDASSGEKDSTLGQVVENSLH